MGQFSCSVTSVSVGFYVSGVKALARFQSAQELPQGAGAVWRQILMLPSCREPGAIADSSMRVGVGRVGSAILRLCCHSVDTHSPPAAL